MGVFLSFSSSGQTIQLKSLLKVLNKLKHRFKFFIFHYPEKSTVFRYFQIHLLTNDNHHLLGYNFAESKQTHNEVQKITKKPQYPCLNARWNDRKDRSEAGRRRCQTGGREKDWNQTKTEAGTSAQKKFSRRAADARKSSFILFSSFSLLHTLQVSRIWSGEFFSSSIASLNRLPFTWKLKARFRNAQSLVAFHWGKVFGFFAGDNSTIATNNDWGPISWASRSTAGPRWVLLCTAGLVVGRSCHHKGLHDV